MHLAHTQYTHIINTLDKQSLAYFIEMWDVTGDRVDWRSSKILHISYHDVSSIKTYWLDDIETWRQTTNAHFRKCLRMHYGYFLGFLFIRTINPSP